MARVLGAEQGVTITRRSDEHIAIELAAAGERDVVDEITRRLMPWARDRVRDRART